MELRQVRELLLPRVEDRDAGFQQEILSLSHRGLVVLGVIELLIGLTALFGFLPWQAAVALLIIGAGTIGVSRVGQAYPHSRVIAMFSVLSSIGDIALFMGLGRPEDFALGAIAVLLLSTAALPFFPVQTLIAGIVGEAAGFATGHHVFLTMMALAATGMTVIVYAQRRSHHESYSNVLQASQEYRALQSRLMLAESSATMVHMSAALAHELSSPIGAVSSGVETLVLLASRQAEVHPSDQKRLTTLQVELGRSLQEPLQRLKKIVTRIQHLTNLNEATVQRSNLNDLVNEAVGLVKPQASNTVRFELDLHPVPEFSCRPRQLIVVLCNVLTNSIQAIDGPGRIAVSTKADDLHLEVKIEDDGRGIPRDRLAHIFDPAFEVADGRASTGNWSLFTSRQLIKEHGGDLRIQSREGSGTTVRLILPASH